MKHQPESRMREICKSGSEGGETGSSGLSYPYHRVFGQPGGLTARNDIELPSDNDIPFSEDDTDSLSEFFSFLGSERAAIEIRTVDVKRRNASSAVIDLHHKSCGFRFFFNINNIIRNLMMVQESPGGVAITTPGSAVHDYFLLH